MQKMTETHSDKGQAFLNTAHINYNLAFSVCYHKYVNNHAPQSFFPQPQCRSISLVLGQHPRYFGKLQNRIPACMRKIIGSMH